MRLLLFDLGGTLELDGALQEGAAETLDACRALTDSEGRPVVLALGSDFYAASAPDDIAGARQEYAAILDALGILDYFEPIERRVTLSVEVGVTKPDRRFFRVAADKASPGLPFHDVFFVTENRGHVVKARQFGLSAIHYGAPGQPTGDVRRLTELVPLVRQWLTPADAAGG